MAISKTIKGIQYFNGYYWSTPDSDPYVYKSADLNTWTLAYTEPRGSDVGQLFVFKDALYLFTTWGDTNIYRTTDGITWYLMYETEDWFDGWREMPIIEENGTMYALSYGSGMLSTTDGVTWHFDQVHWEYFTDAVIVDGWIYGVMNNTRPEPTHVKFLASNPDATWEQSTPFPIEYEYLCHIEYYKGFWYVADDDISNMYRSSDFINWTVENTLDSVGPDLLRVHNDFLFMVSNNDKIYIRDSEKWIEAYDVSIHSEDFDIDGTGQAFINDNWYYSAYEGLSRINIQYEGVEINPNFVITLYLPWDDTQVTLPISNSVINDFDVHWGDDSLTQHVSSGLDPNRIHTYDSGVYTITISGTMQQWISDQDETIKLYMTEVNNIGSTGIIDFGYMFRGCWQLILIEGDCDFSNAVSIEYMLAENSILETVNIENWDLSTINNMKGLFFYSTIINSPNLANWDVSNVITFEETFAGSEGFNINTTNWVTTNAINMTSMFLESQVDLDVSNWDVSNVISMESMFEYSYYANPDVSNWDVSSVETIDWMFNEAIVANPDLSSWQTTAMTDCWGAFWDAILFVNAVPAIQFWDRAAAWNKFDNAFAGAINISNYDNIPAAWK